MRLFTDILILIIILPLLLALAYETGMISVAYLVEHWDQGFLWGGAAYLIAYALMLRHKIKMVEVAEHELGHSTIAALCGKGIDHITFRAESGEVQYTGPSNLYIRLAPYVLPLFTIPLLLIKPLVDPLVREIFNFLVGIALTFHYVRIAKQFRPIQPDISQTGLLRASVVVFVGNALCTSIIFCVLADDLALQNHFANILANTVIIYETVVRWIFL